MTFRELLSAATPCTLFRLHYGGWGTATCPQEFFLKCVTCIQLNKTVKWFCVSLMEDEKPCIDVFLELSQGDDFYEDNEAL